MLGIPRVAGALAIWCLLQAGALQAGPLEFGTAELDRAIVDRGLSARRVPYRAEISTAEPETYRIRGTLITGGDLRGLMYGLLQAAEQVRTRGRLLATSGAPEIPVRGVRLEVTAADVDSEWFQSREYWLDFIQMLARNRFNRLHLALAEDVTVEPGPGQGSAGALPVETLQFLAQTAADHAIDFILGMEDGDYGKLHEILEDATAIRGVHLRNASEAMEFQAVRDAGRRVVVELSGDSVSRQALAEAVASGAPVRLTADFWQDDAIAGSQAEGLFAGNHQLELVWRFRQGPDSADPNAVRQMIEDVPVFGASGFEADVSPEFAGEWLRYRLLGRMGYDPDVSSSVWEREFADRFGDAGPAVLRAQTAAGQLRRELQAALGDSLDTRMDMDGYIAAQPGDPRLVASIPEAVQWRMEGTPFARRGPQASAEVIRQHAAALDAELSAADGILGDGNAEWNQVAPGLRKLAQSARFHSHRLLAAMHLEAFYQTADLAELEAAKLELESGAESGDMSQALDLVAAEEELYQRFGGFTRAINFGGAPRDRRFFNGEQAAPGHVTAGEGLLHGFIEGSGPASFRVDAPPGEYLALIVSPDGNAAMRPVTARDGALDISLDEPDWHVSALLVKPADLRPRPIEQTEPLPRAGAHHIPPTRLEKDGTLRIVLAPVPGAETVRLFYRAVGAGPNFRMCEAPADAADFTIPASETGGQRGFIYYFEVLARHGQGWVLPDASAASHYYAVDLH